MIIGSLIKLTGISSSTGFNLVIPTLFALTFSVACTLVYSLTRRLPFALLGGYFTVLIGNFNPAGQLGWVLKGQPFSYWESSRIIPFTINEFPIWTFLFADLHPHVINLAITMVMLALLLAWILEPGGDQRREWGLVILLAGVFGTLTVVSTWDLPVYMILLLVIALLRALYHRQVGSSLFWPVFWMGIRVSVCYLLGYLLYLPFYLHYQQLSVSGIGVVKQGSTSGDYLTIFGFFLFLALSYWLAELYRFWLAPRLRGGSPIRLVSGFLILSGVVLTFVLLLGLRSLLVVMFGLGSVLLAIRIVRGLKDLYQLEDEKRAVILRQLLLESLTSLLLVMGLGILLGIDLVYIRDFLDGSDYARMNTVFKFSMQAWLCLGLGGALVVYQLWSRWRGRGRWIWSLLLTGLGLICSLFLVLGIPARINDHTLWSQLQPPAGNAQYIPSLDGKAFIGAWYPGDAQGIAWLNEHVSGTPVITEAVGTDSYKWFGRVSAFTGLPDVLGWYDHEQEWRAADDLPLRLGEMNTLYTTLDQRQAVALLQRYHVRYIYVGSLERETYAQNGGAGLAKFDRMVGSTLQVVYKSEGVSIYEVQ